MLRIYRNIGLFFVALFLVTLTGFYWRYLAKAPGFTGMPWFIHVHFTAFLMWFMLLIVQPFLIKYKKLQWHRWLGWFSYALVPVMLFTANRIQQLSYERDLASHPGAPDLDGLINTYVDLSTFALCYLIAIIYRKRLRVHICFITGTALVLLNPGLGRLFFHLLRSGSAVYWTFGVKQAVVAGFMAYEAIRLKKPILRSPWMLLFLILLAADIIYFELPGTPVWHWIADKIVRYTYY
jgi:hypothetical protein